MADTHWYIDTTLGTGADDGTSPTDAWQSIADVGKGMNYPSFNAANRNRIWIRRTSTHTLAIDINPSDDGFADRPIEFIGWPRPVIPNTTITEANFTNGSNIIDNVVGITIDRQKHLGRKIMAPNDGEYLITAILYEVSVDGMAGGSEFTVGSKLTNITQTLDGKIWSFTDNLNTTGTLQYVREPYTVWVNNDNITDADGGDAEIDAGGESAVGFLIDREYAGSTVTGTNGKFQIEADEDYDDRPAAGTVAGWDVDVIDLPEIDGNSADACLYFSADHFYTIKNMSFKNGADSIYGMFYINSNGFRLQGALLYVNNAIDERLVHIATPAITIDRCIFEGGGVMQTNQHAINFAVGGGVIRDSALYGMGGSDIATYSAPYYFENVNFGIERDTVNLNIMNFYDSVIIGRDVKIGGVNGYTNVYQASALFKICIENYQKVLGDHKTFFAGGEYISTDVSGETPNKKLSDTVMKITPNVSGWEFLDDDLKIHVLEHEITVTSGPQTFKYWVYNDMGETLNASARDDIFLKAEYVKSYDNASKYTIAEAFSTEASIEDAADADDWDSISTTINPVEATKVRLKIYWSKYSAAGTFFVDPQLVIG